MSDAGRICKQAAELVRNVRKGAWSYETHKDSLLCLFEVRCALLALSCSCGTKAAAGASCCTVLPDAWWPLALPSIPTSTLLLLRSLLLLMPLPPGDTQVGGCKSPPAASLFSTAGIGGKLCIWKLNCEIGATGAPGDRGEWTRWLNGLLFEVGLGRLSSSCWVLLALEASLCPEKRFLKAASKGGRNMLLLYGLIGSSSVLPPGVCTPGLEIVVEGEYGPGEQGAVAATPGQLQNGDSDNSLSSSLSWPAPAAGVVGVLAVTTGAAAAKGERNDTVPDPALSTMAGCRPPAPTVRPLLSLLLVAPAATALVGEIGGSCHDGRRANTTSMLGDGQSYGVAVLAALCSCCCCCCCGCLLVELLLLLLLLLSRAVAVAVAATILAG